MASTVFLSYGRADGADLAERLHDSLTAVGFRVWQDRYRIRTGTNWDESIERGLRDSQVLISLLTPHAVRRARDGHPSGVDSVCLDEIAYARGVCRIPIVPVQVISCATPLLIYRLQAVDMTGWHDSPARYDVAFQNLSGYLGDVLGGGSRERTWTGAQAGWDFGPFLIEKRRGFTGRAWLFDAIDEWRRRPGGSALLIAGDPGIGKSAIVSELVASDPGGQVLAYHCCQADTPATLDPGRFVRSVASMLAARLPAYADILERPATQELLDGPRLATDPGSAFEGAVLAPLHQLPAPDALAGGAAYLLVDALDEALTRPAPTILDVLASRLQRLPPWVRIVATTRPDRRVMQRLAGLSTETLHAADVRNTGDVRQYVEAQIATPALQRAIQSAGLDPGRLADSLVRAADGNFLFASKAVEAVARGQLTFAHLGTLPPGLGSLYHLFFSRLFPDADSGAIPGMAGDGRIAVAGGGGGGRDAFRTLFQALVSTREPLTRPDLGAVTGLDAEDELPGLLTRVSAFVPQIDGRYALFHRSLFEWLTGWDETLDVPTAGPHYASPRKGQALLAAWAWRDYQCGAASLGPYAMRHLPAHLAAASRFDDLATVLTDCRFLEAKVEGGPGAATSVFDLVNDFTAALTVLPADHPRRLTLDLLREAIRFDAGLIARHPQALFQCCWNRCWWHDAPAAAHFFEGGSDEALSPNAPWRRPGEKLHVLMEAWRSGREQRGRGGVWLRALRPPTDPIGGPQRGVLQAHLKGGIRLALSDDETRLVSGGEWGSVRLWDLQSGATIAVAERDGSVAGVAFVPGTDHLVVAFSHALLFLRADSLTLEGAIDIPGVHVSAMTLAPDGRHVALGQFDGTLRLIDVGRRVECGVWTGHKEKVKALAFAPDGRLASGSGDGSLVVWRLDDGAPKEAGRHAATGAVEAAVFSPDGRRLAWAVYEGAVTCMDLDSGEAWSTQVTPSNRVNLGCLAFGADGACLFFGSGSVGTDGEAEIGILDLGTREVIRRLRGHASVVLGLVVHRDGRRLISAAHDSTIRLWSLDRAHETPELPWWERQIDEAAFSPDGEWIYTAPTQGAFVFVRQVPSGELVGMLSDLKNGVEKIAVSPDGERVAVIDRTGLLRIFWTRQDRPEIECATGATHARVFRFSPDGRFVGLVTYGEALCVVDATSGAKRVDLQSVALPSALDAIVFSRDACLVAGLGSKLVVVADIASGRIVARHEAEDLLYGSTCAFVEGDCALVFEGIREVPTTIEVQTGRFIDVTEAHRQALEAARADAASPYRWGLGVSDNSHLLPESEQSLEMTLGDKRTGAPVAWIPLPWAHETWHHPSGRLWALQRWAQLHVVALEEFPRR